MKSHAPRALRWAACFIAFELALLTSRAGAQPLPPPPAPPAYEDRLMGGNPAPDISLGDAYSYDSSGLARAIRVDALTSLLEGEGANPTPTVRENGIVADAHWETATYGAWSAGGAVRIGGVDEHYIGPSNTNLSFALHQRAMPFDGGWQADNALGDLSLPLIGLERAQTRFLFSSGTMLGATTEWRGPDGVQLIAGGGEPGVLNGIKAPSMTTATPSARGPTAL